MARESRRRWVPCTPTRQRAILVYKREFPTMTWVEMAKKPEFKDAGISPQTLARNYKTLVENDFNCYYTKRHNSGRRSDVCPEALMDAVARLESGEFRDGADVQRHLFPTTPA